MFKDRISKAADENNCIPSMNAISLAYFLKKRRNFRAYAFLTEMICNKLAQQFTESEMPSSTWSNKVIQDSEFHIASAKQIEFARRQHLDVAKVFFILRCMDRHPALIINMNETILTAKRRLKVLAKKGRLPLIPDMIKVPHITGRVAFTVKGHVFDPLIILPNKKTLRSLEDFQDYAYFASSNAGWMTKNIFVYFCVLLICQLSHYHLTLPDELKNERFLLIVDGHKSRDNFFAALLLYLFNIDLLILPSSHLLQPFDIAVALPLKAYFKDDLILENCDLYLQGQDSLITEFMPNIIIDSI